MNTHKTRQSLTHRLTNYHVTIHGTTMHVPPQSHCQSDSEEPLHPNSAAIPEVANV